MTAGKPTNSTSRPLRLLVVDDNCVNLSVLSTLLKRRFSHIVDGAPVTVDSGLKAIQLLRTHVFDCILMDIQMPFLSGLDTSRRIRNAEDGILAANKDVQIVAVTTAVGDEPELAYRRARMDGMIGKPVRFQQLQDYLCPLSREAGKAASSVQPVKLDDGVEVMPPLPPSSVDERVFYLPVGAITPTSRPEICKHENFEQLLNRQTQASLRQCAIATLTFVEGVASTSLPKPQCMDDIATHNTDSSEHCHLLPALPPSSRSNSSSSMEAMRQSGDESSTPGSSLSRNGSMTISRTVFRSQVAREVAKLDSENDLCRASSSPKSVRTVRRVQSRPQMTQRGSSPCWLLSEESQQQQRSERAKAGTTNTSLEAMGKQAPPRPKLAALLPASSSGPSSSASSNTSDSDSSRRLSDTSRTDSRVSTGSTDSGASSTVTTPAYENSSPYFALEDGLDSRLSKLSFGQERGTKSLSDFQSAPITVDEGTAATSS